MSDFLKPMTPIRTTLFGGSFNPIHNGHIRLSRHLIEEGMTDEVWLLVSPQNPLKEKTGLLNEQFRLELAQKALQNEPHILASDFEFHLPRPSYTWKTLEALTASYPERTFSLLIGSDNWLIFDRWAKHDDILQNHELFVYPRPGYPVHEDLLPTQVHLLKNAPLYPYSSTQIRQALVLGTPCSEMIPNSISKDLLQPEVRSILTNQ